MLRASCIRSRGFKLAITSEVIGKLGGGDVKEVPVGQFSDSDHVIHSFTLDKPSVVSATLTGLNEDGRGRWAPPAPSIEVRPPSGGLWGETRFGASLMVHSSTSSVPPESHTENARYLSISTVLPPGDYEIVINTQGSSRTYTVDTATIVTTPL